MAQTMIGPLQIHGVRTAADYRAKQAEFISRLRIAKPDGPWGDPHPVAVPIPAYVSAGRWVVRCPCGNGAAASAEWGIACCFECGAVYEAILFPDDREQIEAVLLLRRNENNRHWLLGETIAGLIAENLEHGELVPA